MNDFGNYLYTLRKAKGYTQAELADKLGVTNKAVSKWETGEAFPETAQLVPLADIFGVTTDELLRGRSAQSAIPPQENETPPAESAEEIARKYQPDWWHKKFAALIVCGFASIAAGVISVIAAGLLTETEWVHIAVTCALMALIGIGVDLFIYAGVASEYAFLPVKDGAWKSQLGAFIRRLLAGMSFVMLGVIGIVSCGLFEEGGAVAQPCGIRRRYSGGVCLSCRRRFLFHLRRGRVGRLPQKSRQPQHETGGSLFDGRRKRRHKRGSGRAGRSARDRERRRARQFARGQTQFGHHAARYRRIFAAGFFGRLMASRLGRLPRGRYSVRRRRRYFQKRPLNQKGLPAAVLY